MQHIFWQPAFLLALLSPVQSARNLRDTSSSSANSGSSNLPSAWATGIATNYGGPSEGKDPSSPSFGTSDVSLPVFTLLQQLLLYLQAQALLASCNCSGCKLVPFCLPSCICAQACCTHDHPVLASFCSLCTHRLCGCRVPVGMA